MFHRRVLKNLYSLYAINTWEMRHQKPNYSIGDFPHVRSFNRRLIPNIRYRLSSRRATRGGRDDKMHDDRR